MKRFYLVAILAVLLFVTGCSKSEPIKETNNGNKQIIKDENSSDYMEVLKLKMLIMICINYIKSLGYQMKK